MTIAPITPVEMEWVVTPDPQPIPTYPPGIKRVKNDYEREDMQYMCRTLLPDWKNQNMRQAPQVVPLFLTANHTSGGNRTNMTSWKSYLFAINGITSEGDRKWRYYTAKNSGWYNKKEEGAAGWPTWEALTMGDNLVNVVETYRGFSRIETLYLEGGPPDPGVINYHMTPWLVHRFTVITPNNSVIDPPPGRIYTPIVVKRFVNRVPGEYWIPSEWLCNPNYNNLDYTERQR